MNSELGGVLADALAGDTTRLVYGVVSTVNPLTVVVAPSTTAVRMVALGSAVYGIGSKVAILRLASGDCLVLGLADGGYGGAYGAGRNMFDNSSFEVDQRNPQNFGIPNTRTLTIPNSGASQTMADRWQGQQITSLASMTGYNYDVSNPVTSYPGPRTLILGGTTGALASNHWVRYWTKLTGRQLQRLKKGTAGAQPFTVSFGMAGNTTNITVIVECQYITIDGGTRSCSQPVTLSGINVLERGSCTFPADTGGAAIPDDDEDYMYVYIWVASGSDFAGGAALNTTWTAAPAANTSCVGVTNQFGAFAGQCNLILPQMEVGSVATPPERRPYAQELLQCMRFLNYQYGHVVNVPHAMGQAYSGTTAMINFPFAVPLRHQPTVTFNGTFNVSTAGFGTAPMTAAGAWNYGPSVYGIMQNMVMVLTCGGGGLVAGSACILLGSLGGSIVFSAE